MNLPSPARILACAGVCLLAVAASDARAQERPIAFTGATILPVTGPAIPNGTLVVQRGKIVAVGANVVIPADAERRDAGGKVIMPGIVDTHSHVGQVSGADGSGSVQPDVRALDSINPNHKGFGKARAGGVTTVNVMPGSGFVMSGQTLYLKLRPAGTVEGMMYRFADGAPLGGMKMANGTNPLRGTAGFSGTRAKTAAMARAAFTAARPYCKGKRTPRDLGKDALCEILDGRRMVHFHSHRADDIATALRLRREFGFRLTLHHVTEGYKVADLIAAEKVGASAIVLDSPGGKLETMDTVLTMVPTMDRAGVLTSFHSDDPIIDSRFLMREAGLAVRAGMARERALMALTINGARQLDLADRVGSLEVGKDADFLILSGDPLSVYTKVEQTWIEGAMVFDRTRAEDLLLATGGYGAGGDGVASHVLEQEAHGMEQTQ